MALALLLSTPVLAQSAKTGPAAPATPTAAKLAPPANDNFASATVISGDGMSLSSTIEATQEAGEPVVPAACATGDSNQSVWFTFTAGVTGSATFDTAGSLVASPPGPVGQFTDTIMSIYTGTAIGSLVQVACNDDDPTNPTGGGDFTSRIVTNVTTGTTYYVRVSSYFGGNRHDGEARLTYTGIGTGTPPAGPSIAANPTSVNFGNVVTNTASPATSITLTNNGDAAATVSSIVAAGPGFSVNLTGTDLTLDPAQTTTFTVTFSPTVVGAATGTVTIASNDPGSPDVVTLTGTGVAPGGPLTYPSTGGPFPIPDNQPTNPLVNTITVPAGAPTILDLDLDLDITHSWVGDLTVTLEHNGGVQDTLISRPRRLLPGDTVGCEENDINAFVDDEGTNGSFETGCAAANSANPAYITDGRYTPDDPLSVYDGASATGTWTIRITDSAGLDTGRLNAWAVLVTPTTVANEGGASAGSRLVAAPNPVSTSGQLTLSVATSQNVRVALYDMLGREVRVLFQGALSAGQEAYIGFNATDLQAGAYVVRAEGESLALSQRVTVTH